MPTAAPRYCPRGHGGYSGPRCPRCSAEQKTDADQRRPSARARGYNVQWEKLRAEHLRLHPVCVACGGEGKHVDHVRAHKGDARLFWSGDNLQTLCAPCHSSKTARHDGAFGNPIDRLFDTGGRG